MGSGTDSIKEAREREIERKIKVRIQSLREELPKGHVELILEFIEVGRTRGCKGWLERILVWP